jgi:hypothetical protein
MFFAGHAAEEDAKQNSHHAVAKDKSHNALPQLSVSRAARKVKARCGGVCVKRQALAAANASTNY